MNSRILRITVICLILFGFSTLDAESGADSKRKGCFEIGFHYGFWSINLLKSTIESELSDALETEIKEPILDEIQADYPEIVEKSYSQEINFDSSGHNFGFDVRWYPKGKNGSFSLGLSLEKTSMLLSIPDIRVILESTQGHVFQGEGTGYFDINPVSIHLSFCWDIKPIWRINPYIVFGFGFAWGNVFNDAEISYSVSGTLVQLGQVLDTYEQSDTMTVAELKQDLEDEGEDFFIPDFFPFFQLNAGVKGEVTRNIFMFLDVGFWDGFMIRGGFAFRFL